MQGGLRKVLLWKLGWRKVINGYPFYFPLFFLSRKPAARNGARCARVRRATGGVRFFIVHEGGYLDNIAFVIDSLSLFCFFGFVLGLPWSFA